MSRRGWLAALAALAVVLVVLLAEREPVRDSYVPVLNRDHPLIAGQGVDTRRRTIEVGALVPLTGTGSAAGAALLEGLRFELARSQQEPALHGWQLRVQARDTEGESRREVAVFPSLARHVALLGLTYGLKATESVLPRARRFGFMVVPADARYARLEHDPSIAVLGAPYSVDAANAVASVANGAAPVGLAQAPGAFAQELARGYRAAVEREPRLAGPTVDLEGSPASADRAVRALHAAGARSVLVADPQGAAAGELLRAADRAGYAFRWLLLGPAWSPELLAAAPTGQLSRVTVAMATAPFSSGAARALGRLAHARGADFVEVAEGAAIGRLLEAVAARGLADRDLSERGLLDARLRLGQLDLGGLMAGYRAAPTLPIGTDESLLAAYAAGTPDHVRAVRSFFATPAGEAVAYAEEGRSGARP